MNRTSPGPGRADLEAERAGLARVARGGALNLAGALVSAMAGLGLTVIVTQNFARPVAGAFFVAMSLFLIVESVANLGAYNGAVYFIARLRTLHADRRIPAVMRAAVVPVLVASVAGAAAVIVWTPVLARVLLDGRSGDGVSPAAIAGALRALAIALPFAALADTLLGATRGYHEMRPTVIVDRIGRPGLQALGVLAAALAGSSVWLAPTWALPYVAASIVSLFWLRLVMRRHQVGTGPARPSARQPTEVLARGGTVRPGGSAAPGTPRTPWPRSPDGPEPPADNRHGQPNAKGFWRFTGPRSLAGVAQVVIQRLDIVLVGVLRGPVDAAVYTAATRFLVAGQLGNAAISMAAQPQLTKLFALGDRCGVNAVYQATTAWLILLTWPLYLLAMIFGPAILAIFGRSYHAGSTVILILGSAMLVATACGQVDTVLITSGRSTWSQYNGLAAMGVNVGVDLVLIPRFGITGAAIGWAAAIGITNLVPLVQVAVAVRVHPFGSGSAAAILISALSFAVIPLAARIWAGSSVTVTVTAIGLGCTVMAVGLWQLRWLLKLDVIRWSTISAGRGEQ